MGIRNNDAGRAAATEAGGPRASFLRHIGLAASIAGGAVIAHGLSGASSAFAAERQASSIVVAQVNDSPAAAPAGSSSPETGERVSRAPAPAMLRDAAFRKTSDETREAATTSAAPSGQAPDDDAVMLRMLASADIAVPIEDLGDALITTGSIAPGNRTAPISPPSTPQLSAVVASLLPTPPASPTPNGMPFAAERNFDSSPAATPDVAAIKQAGHIVSSVKMRAKPENSAEIVSVLAANAAVAVIGCDYWCEVEIDGRRGFVFKKFVKTN